MIPLFRGIYGTISAMLVQEKTVDVSSNNLANANTSGFSKSQAVAEVFGEVPLVRNSHDPQGQQESTSIGSSCLGVVLSETAVDTSPGTIHNTGNPLDCAIKDEGYFQVTDGNDNFYTRAGSFSLDSEGQIVTPSGLNLQGNGGPLVAGEASSVEIRNDGSVFADGEEIGKIAVFRFQEPSLLLRRGSSLLAETGASGAPIPLNEEDIQLEPKAIEGSNVNIVEEMTRMIEANRAYEAASKAFETEAETASSMIRVFGS